MRESPFRLGFAGRWVALGALVFVLVFADALGLLGFLVRVAANLGLPLLS
jgi:hypothetical protein